MYDCRYFFKSGGDVKNVASDLVDPLLSSLIRTLSASQPGTSVTFRLRKSIGRYGFDTRQANVGTAAARSVLCSSVSSLTFFAH